MQRGTNLGRLGDFNQAVIFDSIRRAKDGVSRVELAESTGLSPQTISNVVRRLLDDGLVREDRTVVSGPGKPRTVLELETNRLMAIGIHLDPGLISLVMLNLRGEVAVHKRLVAPEVGDPADTIGIMASAVEELIEESGQPRDRIVGVGVAAPGPLNPAAGIVSGPPLLDGWTEVEVVKPLAEKLGLEVLLEKDTIAAAIAELWNGDEEEDQNFISVYVGTGIGVGMVVGGEILRGVSNNAGEIGHFSVGEKAAPCECGRDDCLAGVLSFAHLSAKAREAGLPVDAGEDAGVAARAEAMNTFVRLAVEEEPAAVELLRGFCARTADMVGQLVNVLDVDKVIVGGPIWAEVGHQNIDEVGEIINERFSVRSIHGVRVVSSTLGANVGAIGGACAVLDAALSPKASALLLR
ncbi:ROK family transcriptional regulator [Zafaria sp. Z1313]|uniref:ROK family transcriptional regulator n=1 Tax=unclassified Zafaria TaxID=2828765 RepID=UPI002E7647BA|nr:ROK family transcriptional regulator [Zafaria sp. J156]MEE1622247.1 ROK family transcriptional regulator [Zafaria sp. J156]